MRLTRRRTLAGLAGSALALRGGALRAAEDEPRPLEKIRRRGRLIVAVYKEQPPFFEEGKGIDADLAAALASELGQDLSLLPFQAGENMADDLRNMVWRGHYLGYGPADVMLHVPVEAPLMQANPQVRIFAPYYRERVMLARDLKAVPKLESLDDLQGKRLAAAGQSLAGWLMIGAQGGRLREQLNTRWRDGVAAASGLLKGEVDAAAGHASELESVLAGDPRFAIEPLPMPRAPRDGWAIGCAVRQEADDLAAALQAAIDKLAADGRLGAIFARRHVAWRKP